MGLKIFINGEFVNSEDAKVSVFDHGLLYGDGVFEGIRSYGRKVFKLEEHVNRLYESADAIKMTIPMSKDEMTEKIIETLRINDLDDAYIRVVATRGVGDLVWMRHGVGIGQQPPGRGLTVSLCGQNVGAIAVGHAVPAPGRVGIGMRQDRRQDMTHSRAVGAGQLGLRGGGIAAVLVDHGPALDVRGQNSR